MVCTLYYILHTTTSKTQYEENGHLPRSPRHPWQIRLEFEVCTETSGFPESLENIPVLVTGQRSPARETADRLVLAKGWAHTSSDLGWLEKEQTKTVNNVNTI